VDLFGWMEKTLYVSLHTDLSFVVNKIDNELNVLAK